ncbi:Alkaline_phosphatase [Hexamita inflata]|uniref:Alkaline phosphatase n=2 Tax=Hexamita inflata TaxID=28002 RepID=A0AA86S076_9EUKA|nr:Alkaline phosphatase [Hexamita inflata]
MELVNSFEMECNTMKYTTANKTSVLVRRLIDLSNYLILLVVCGISSWQYAHHGFLLENIIITACAVILSIATTIIAEKKVNQCRSKTYCISTISVALIITGIALGTLANLVTQLPFVLFYGPLSFIHDDKTRIHWASNRGSNSYHNTMYSGTNFNYSFNGKQYQNVLPDQIQKFVVMTDIHQNNQYTSTMSTNYDFAVFCGDYSNSGKLSEFQNSFQGMPTKPLLMAMGNHDEPGNFSQVNGRGKNYFQKVRNLGFYFIHVQQSTPIVDLEVDRGIQFILDNIDIGVKADHVFIVVHHPVFSTGEFGSHQYFSQKIESLIVDHPELNIRATFSGHDHLFSAFQKGRQYFFVNGAGGGGIDQMTDSSYGVRKWPREELHGALPIVADNCYGYDLHLDSWMKFTRTEVNILKDKIVYDVRDLDSDVILQSYEQPI